MHQTDIFTSKSSIGSSYPCDELWLETCVDCVVILLFFQLLDFPSGPIYWLLLVSLLLFKKQWVSPSLPLLENSRFQIREGPHHLILLLLRQVLPLLCPSTRQGMHLAAALENSTLRRISNFFSSCFQVSPLLGVPPDFWMQSDFRG